MMRLTSTTMLKGFFSTFRIRFFKRRLVRGFLGKPFFDTITPLSEVCRGIAGDSSLLSFLSSVRSLTSGVPSSGIVKEYYGYFPMIFLFNFTYTV